MTNSATPAPSAESTGLVAPLRVLVVDDDAGIRMLLQVTIELDARFALVGTAGSTSEALEFAADASSGSIDAALVDVTLPDGDGVELLGQLRALLPGAALALYTGWSDPATARRAATAGADQLFSKSLEPQRLLDQLLELARTRR